MCLFLFSYLLYVLHYLGNDPTFLSVETHEDSPRLISRRASAMYVRSQQTATMHDIVVNCR